MVSKKYLNNSIKIFNLTKDSEKTTFLFEGKDELFDEIYKIPKIQEFLDFLEKNKNLILFEGTKLEKVKLTENIPFLNTILKYKNNNSKLKNETDFNKVIKQFEKDFVEYMEIPQNKPIQLISLGANFFQGSDHNKYHYNALYTIKSIFGLDNYIDLNEGINKNISEEDILLKIEEIIQNSKNREIVLFLNGHGTDFGEMTYKNGFLKNSFFQKLTKIANKYKNISILNDSCLNGYKYKGSKINGKIFTNSGKENAIKRDADTTEYHINYMDYNNDGINSAKELAFNQMLNYSSSLIGNYGFLNYAKEKYGE